MFSINTDALMLSFYNYRNRRLVQPAVDLLLKPFRHSFFGKTHTALVLGTGALCGATAVEMVEQAARGRMSKNIVIVGGAIPHKTLFANFFYPIQNQLAEAEAGLPLAERRMPSLPRYGENEAVYIARAFKEGLERKGLDASAYTIILNPKDESLNTQTNIKQAVDLGILSQADLLTLVTLPYARHRVMGTWDKAMGDDWTDFSFMPNYPTIFGITKDNCLDSPHARAALVGEYKKVAVLKPQKEGKPQEADYVKRGFIVPVDVPARLARAHQRFCAGHAASV